MSDTEGKEQQSGTDVSASDSNGLLGSVLLLTEEQEAAIEPLMERLREFEKEGKPGMAVAQVFPDHIKVGILGHEKAKAMLLAMGVEEPQYARNAFSKYQKPNAS